MRPIWGKTLILSCHNPDGLKRIVKWMKGDDVIENETKLSLELHIKNSSDLGTYICRNGPFTSKTILPELRIIFLKRPHNISVVSGSTITLTYKIKTDPVYTLHGSWMQEKMHQKQRIHSQSGHTLAEKIFQKWKC